MHVYFSTIVRYAPPEKGGEFISVNWDTKQVEQRVPAILDNLPVNDPNPRGNSRGGRGIVVMDGKLICATYHTLKIYDYNLRLLRQISHPLMVNLHEIYPVDDRTLWVTCTATDAVLLVDLETGEVIKSCWLRDMSSIQKRWGVKSLQIDRQADLRPLPYTDQHYHDPSHLHLNAVTLWRGEVYAFLNRFGAIVNLDTDEVILEEPGVKMGHNLIIREDGLAFVNDTRGHHVYLFDLVQRKLVRRINLLPFHPVGTYTRFYDFMAPVRKVLRKTGIYDAIQANPFFVRGLDLVDDKLFIGISPASILCVDWERSKVIDYFSYSTDVRQAIHGIKVVEN